MIDAEETDDMRCVREIGKTISEFRKEHMNRIMQTISDEADEIVKEGFDPAEGSGRGPLWAQGG